jgi:hypothetical protein
MFRSLSEVALDVSKTLALYGFRKTIARKCRAHNLPSAESSASISLSFRKDSDQPCSRIGRISR